MRLRGSVLIVILGLLAILAVVGITFVTMSSIDSNTASNFALQAQFDLAADAAVDYVSHALVQDLWEFDTSATSSTTYRKYTGRALTGLPGNEYYDFPQSGTPTATTPDTWLATNWVSSSAPPGAMYSFWTDDTVTLYNLSNQSAFGGTAPPADGPDNLGIPGTSIVRNGLWIADLAFPYGGGVIRVSVTVQDHAAMVNLNAHGNVSDQQKWPYSGGRNYGYFISDVAPFSGGFNLDAQFPNKLVLGESGTVPGRWSQNNGPGIKQTGEVLIQNPAQNSDLPYTLDEEFELRRLSGTYATTRLEYFGGDNLSATPASSSATALNNRLNLTTVGWTAEVRGHALDKTTPTKIITGSGTAQLKADLNLDDVAVISTALTDGRAFDSTANQKQLAQFLANITGFRERPASASTGPFFKSSGGYTGARRQVILTKVKLTKTLTGPPQDKWDVRVQVFNPWNGDYAGAATTALYTSGLSVNVYSSTGIKVKTWALPAAGIAEKGTAESGTILNAITLNHPSSGTIESIASIKLEGASPWPPILDQILSGSGGSLPSTGSGGCVRRKVGVEDELRGGGTGEKPVRVFYVLNWITATPEGSWNKIDNLAEAGASTAIPIRFPNSVPPLADRDPKTKGPLPPFTSATDGMFKAFVRIGDLNQVLCPKDEVNTGTAFWPWIDTIAKAAATDVGEAQFKFNWKDTNPPGDLTKFSRMNAANVLTTERPWLDSYDNDGDGKKDDEDLGTYSSGAFCGTEIRVAGKVNLNTATDKTLNAIETGVGIPTNTLVTAVKNLRGAMNTTPILSVAQLLNQLPAGTTGARDAKGPLEVRDMWFTRLSNIATVRSDTFSVYGTVQYVEPPARAQPAGQAVRIIKSRRFWALVDRSPSLAFYPLRTDSNRPAFVHPRIMNFQWLD